HYLKEKLCRMETTRKKREQAGLDTMTSTSCPVSLSSSPESSELSLRSSPEIVAPTPGPSLSFFRFRFSVRHSHELVSIDELRREEEQLYLSGTAMECFRHFYEYVVQHPSPEIVLSLSLSRSRSPRPTLTTTHRKIS